MLRFMLKRLGGIIITLFCVSIFVFLFVRLIPGDPARLMLGDSATPEAIEAITEQYGLDEPLLTQYGMWLEGVFHGDFGTSIRTRMPVMYEIGMRYGNTMILAVCSIVWSVAAGMIMGIWSGTHPNKWQDNVGITVSVIGQAVPNFWLGLMLILVFCVKLGVFPIISSGDIRGLILPSITLGAYMMAAVARFIRSSVIETMKEDYIRTARAKGLRERTVIYRHVLKNFMIPVITIVGLNFGVMLGGAVIVESVFGYSGIGMLLVDSINFRDYPMIQMLILIFSLHFVVINLIVDLLYAVVNPEIRLS